MRLNERSVQENLSKHAKREIAIYITLLSIIVVPLVLGYAQVGVLPDWLFYPGIALFLAGNLFTLWSRSVLGRFWSGEVRVLTENSVVEKGPYRLIRHPMYAGQLLLYFGFGLALQSWSAILFILIVVIVGSANRIRIEEKLLATEPGSTYTDYMKRTKRLIRFIL